MGILTLFETVKAFSNVLSTSEMTLLKTKTSALTVLVPTKKKTVGARAGAINATKGITLYFMTQATPYLLNQMILLQRDKIRKQTQRLLQLRLEEMHIFAFFR